MLGRILNSGARTLHGLKSRLRAALVRTRFPGADIGQNVIIYDGTAFSITDGGRLKVGDNVAFEKSVVVIVKSGQLTIGPRSFIGAGSHIVARDRVEIGSDALIAEHVTIRDQDHDFSGPLPTAQNGFKTAPIVIGDNVWIGAKATVVRGVTIGDNAVIGANSVVTKDVPANSIAVGSPARVVRTIKRA